MKNTGLANSPLFFNKKNREKEQPLKHDFLVSRNHEISVADLVKSLQIVGKKASTYRLSNEEKLILTKIIYTYRLKNFNISENDIIRIGVHILYADFKLRKERSILFNIINNISSKSLNKVSPNRYGMQEK